MKQQKIKLDDAWLNINVEDDEIFNPMKFVFSGDTEHEKIIEKISWLLMQPEYFAFTCKQILNIEIAPFQLVLLQEIWDKKFPMLIGSRGMSKSFTLAIYCILRCLLMPRRKIIVVGAAFRQSKVIFEYMETIWKNAPILRDLCDNNSGPSRDIDRCVLRINQGTITCLPLGNGEKIRGQRANDIIADEFACLEAGSIVETVDGFVRIEDFDSHKIITGDAAYPVELPYKFIKTPLTDVYEIKLENGNVIRCSENHQVMTNEGWRKPKELNDGLYIEKSKQAIFSSINPSGLTIDLAWLLGILVSEGSVIDKKRIHVKTTDINLCYKLVNKFNFKFSKRSAYNDHRGWDCKESYDVYLDNEILRTQLFNLGLEYVSSHNKIVPKSILKSTKETIISFLSGLFDGDGSCFLWKDKDIENKIGLAYYSVSERLCRDIQFLASKLGFDGYINKRKSNISKNDQWFVRWNNNNAKNFATLLNVDRFKYTIDNCATTDDPSYITWDKSKNKWKVQYLLTGKNIQKRFVEYKDAFNYVKHLKSLDIFQKIVSVHKLSNKQNLYDYYLPITNSFYAEGFRQHNSIPRDIFENVVAGFASVSASPIEKVKMKAKQKLAKKLGQAIEDPEKNLVHKSNQIILAGTAYYDFNHFAEYWKKYKQIIETRGSLKKLEEIFGDTMGPDFNWRDYCIFRIPANYLPEGFMDDAQISRAKATVHSGIFQMEYGSVFTSDSQGFFKRSLIESCVVSEQKPVKLPSGEVFFEPMLYGDGNKQYIFGVDPASEVDNFSIVVLELNGDHRRIVHCWTTTRQEHKERVKTGLADEDDFYSYCARKIRNLMKIFPCREIAMDSQGGGIAVMEALHDKDKIREGELAIWPTIDPDKEKDTDDKPGLHILQMCNFAKADWLAEANHGMRKDMEDKVLLFPMFDAVSVGLSAERDKIENRIYDTLEDCVMEIESLKDELSMIVLTQTGAGRERWDTPDVKTSAGRKARLRKDRYSALLMANMSARQKPQENIMKDYMCVGGFAQSGDKDENSKDYFIGPNWWTENMEEMY